MTQSLSTLQFYLKTRHILNYIERECLKPIKFKADFDTICIDLRYGFSKDYIDVEPYISASNTLEIILPFDKDIYDRLLSEEAYYTYILGCLSQGFNKCKELFNMPMDAMLTTYQNFQEQGCINTWTIQEKCIHRKSPSKVRLTGALSMTQFRLHFQIIEQSIIQFSKKSTPLILMKSHSLDGSRGYRSAIQRLVSFALIAS